MNIGLQARKELLLRKNEGNRLKHLYLKDLEMLLSKTFFEHDLIPLEETDTFKDIHFDEKIIKNFTQNEFNEMNNFISFFKKHVPNENSFLFTYYARYCGTVKTKTKIFLDNYRNVLKIRESIASIVSEDRNNELLIDADQSKFEIEIKGKEWICIAKSY